MVHLPFNGIDIPYDKQVQEHTLHPDGKEYVVCLREGVDYDKFWTEIESNTLGLSHIPDRPVRVLNELPGFERICHYVLSDQEAQILKSDPRVSSVNPPFETIPGLVRTITSTQTGNFNKPIYTSNGNFKNWGLLRTNYSTNPYTLTTNTLNVPNQYDYNLDGTNVDVVIMDTGIEPDHPEFTDANGVSRVKKISWFKEAGMSEYVDLNSSINWASIDPSAYTGPRIGNDGGLYFITTLAYDSQSYLNWQSQGGSIYWPGSIKLGLPIKASSTGTEKIGYSSVLSTSIGAQDSNHSYVVRCKMQSSWGLINNKGVEIDWQIKFCDSNHMEITIIRHDYITSKFKDYTTGNPVGGTPEFGMTTFAGNTIDFTSAFINKQQLYGSASQPISIVLSTGDNGTNWTINQNSKMVYANNAWQIAPGVANVINPATLSKTDNTNAGLFFGTPFSFKIGPAIRKYFYSDFNGHGTHCTGIMAGKTFGWAKNANIYMMKLNDLTSFSNPDWYNGFNEYMCWGLIKKFHENKPINPATGVKNPTIVNMSFGTSLQFVDAYYLTGGTYRGANWTPTVATQTDLSSRGVPDWKYYPAGTYNIGGQPYTARKGLWVNLSCDFDASDTGLSELINSGVICCIAAGNNGMRADNSSGADYNNILLLSNGFGTNTGYHYNRGGSPKSSSAIMVGSIDFVFPNNATDPQHIRATNNINNLDQVAYYTNTGSLVDIYSPGTYIMSATSNINSLGGVPYNENSAYKQVNISGTSMATPQVVGLLALYMQQNPSKTPAQAKQWIIDNSKATLYTTNLDSDYSTYYSLKGGPNRQMFNPLVTSSVITSAPVVTDAGTATNPINVAANSTNNMMTFGIQNGASSVSVTVPALHGTTNINGLLITYTPATNYVGSDTFKFVARNSGGTSNVGTAYVIVKASDISPIAYDVTATVQPGAVTAILPSVNVLSFNSLVIVTNPFYGTAVVQNNTLVYTSRPNSLVYTDNNFSYKIINNAGTSNTALVNVHIVPATVPAPVARNVTITISANSTVKIATDTDYATDIRLVSNTLPNTTINYTYASLSNPNFYDIKSGLAFSYTPPRGFVGTDVITYSAYQAQGDSTYPWINVGTTKLSAAATITVNIIDAQPTKGMSISNGVVMTNGINLRLI